MSDQLAEFEEIASAILTQLQPSARSSLLRKLAADLRRSQAKRIAAQKAPDGSPFPARKPQRDNTPINSEVRFLYRKPSGAERVADLKSWRDQGSRITGFDREAGAIRTFLKERIKRHLPPEGQKDPGALPTSLRGKKGAIKRKAKAMFTKMRLARNLTYGADPNSAWVEFTSRASRIARIHQFGLRDRPSPKAKEVQYPKRELLGFSQEDREGMLSRLLEHLED